MSAPVNDWRMVPLAQISKREAKRLRPADPAKVAMIAESLRERGVIHPIVVYHAPNEGKGATPYVLMAGLHRIHAAELLGWTEIAAKVLPADWAGLIEIEENLYRADLTQLDRALAVRAYRRLWEEKNGKIPLKGGRPKKNCRKLQQFSKQMLGGSWSERLAGQMGCSRDGIFRSNRIAGIASELRDLLVGTATGDNQSRLLAIADAGAEKQAAIVHAVTKGGCEIEAAIDEAIAAAAEPAMPVAQRRINAVRSNLEALDRQDRMDLLKWCASRFPDEIREALASNDDGAGS